CCDNTRIFPEKLRFPVFACKTLLLISFVPGSVMSLKIKLCFPKRSGKIFSSEKRMQPMKRFTGDRKSTRLNSSHVSISYAVFCLKKKTQKDKDCTVKAQKAQLNKKIMR